LKYRLHAGQFAQQLRVVARGCLVSGHGVAFDFEAWNVGLLSIVMEYRTQD
jgi:hypothetical protein